MNHKIYVVGIGGAGVNITNKISDSEISEFSVVGVDTGRNVCNWHSRADYKIQMGKEATKGISAMGSRYRGNHYGRGKYCKHFRGDKNQV